MVSASASQRLMKNAVLHASILAVAARVAVVWFAAEVPQARDELLRQRPAARM